MKITIEEGDKTVSVNTTDGEMDIETMESLLKALLLAYGYGLSSIKLIFHEDDFLNEEDKGKL